MIHAKDRPPILRMYRRGAMTTTNRQCVSADIIMGITMMTVFVTRSTNASVENLKKLALD